MADEKNGDPKKESEEDRDKQLGEGLKQLFLGIRSLKRAGALGSVGAGLLLVTTMASGVVKLGNFAVTETPPPTKSIAGYLYQHGQHPIEGAYICANALPGSPCNRTDRNGFFSFDNIAATTKVVSLQIDTDGPQQGARMHERRIDLRSDSVAYLEIVIEDEGVAK